MTMGMNFMTMVSVIIKDFDCFVGKRESERDYWIWDNNNQTFLVRHFSETKKDSCLIDFRELKPLKLITNITADDWRIVNYEDCPITMNNEKKETFGFEMALELAKDGFKVARKGWIKRTPLIYGNHTLSEKDVKATDWIIIH